MDPYAQVAELYELEYGRLEADVAFYARNGTGGPLLVGGCGTGRVARRLATDRKVTGVDRSAAMLAVARRLAPELRWVQADLRDFDEHGFSEVILPNAAFSFLATRADQQRCLERCHAALKEGGLLTIDVPMPAFHLWSIRDGPERLAWAGALPDGRPVRRTRQTRRFLAEQRLELTDRFYIDDRLVHTSALRLRVFLPSEAEWMLEASGFAVDEILGDYSGGRLQDGSPRILVRALRL
ncbi:MAG: methyltransferase domain-containing protein [Alphaproteobacteria bacterium]|nr:methyltransferase domain-containing protein [Alphaproteobacteria bacterium]